MLLNTDHRSQKKSLNNDTVIVYLPKEGKQHHLSTAAGGEMESRQWSRDTGTNHESESEIEVAQLCLTLYDPMDCSPPGSSVHGIFQARVLEWVAIAFSRASSRPRDWTRVSPIVGRRFTVWATREAQSRSCCLIRTHLLFCCFCLWASLSFFFFFHFLTFFLECGWFTIYTS